MHQTGFRSAAVVPQCKFTELCSSAAVVSQSKYLPSCVARQLLCHKVNLPRCEARWRHLIMTCDIFSNCFKSFDSHLNSNFALTNPVKAFNGMRVRLTSITFPVIWSSVLISVTREWRYCGLVYKFFPINNI